MSFKDVDSGVVYSTEKGRLCPTCTKSAEACLCKHAAKQVSGDGIVRLRFEKKGRKGKGVVLISGVPLQDDELKQLAKQLKQQLGTGGSVKQGVIEIQGEHLPTIKAALVARGYTVKGG